MLDLTGSGLSQLCGLQGPVWHQRIEVHHYIVQRLAQLLTIHPTLSPEFPANVQIPLLNNYAHNTNTNTNTTVISIAPPTV